MPAAVSVDHIESVLSEPESPTVHVSEMDLQKQKSEEAVEPPVATIASHYQSDIEWALSHRNALQTIESIENGSLVIVSDKAVPETPSVEQEADQVQELPVCIEKTTEEIVQAEPAVEPSSADEVPEAVQQVPEEPKQEPVPEEPPADEVPEKEEPSALQTETGEAQVAVETAPESILAEPKEDMLEAARQEVTLLEPTIDQPLSETPPVETVPETDVDRPEEPAPGASSS